MEIKDIMLIVSVVLITIVNTLVGYYQTKAYKAKDKLLNGRIKNLSELYLPVLLLMMAYYSDREDYISAQKCKELIKAISEMDKIISS